MKELKQITHKFEDQDCVPASLHAAHKADMNNIVCCERFENLAEALETCGWEIGNYQCLLADDPTFKPSDTIADQAECDQAKDELD